MKKIFHKIWCKSVTRLQAPLSSTYGETISKTNKVIRLSDSDEVDHKAGIDRQQTWRILNY